MGRNREQRQYDRSFANQQQLDQQFRDDVRKPLQDLNRAERRRLARQARRAEGRAKQASQQQ